MIPIFEAKRLDKKIAGEVSRAIDEVIRNGIYILGKKVIEFENEFSRYLGVKHAVGVASGTDAISLALQAAGAGAGDEVIMPANSYPTVFGITGAGAKPVLVDIDQATFNIDPGKIEKAITKKTKAVIAVHLYGQPADLGKIIPIVKKHKLKLIEDAAQAHGAEIKINGKWRKAGTVGDAGCFSFYPTKNLGGFGDGGMVVTNSETLFKKVKLLRMYGEEKRYESVLVGTNSRLDELQAAILTVKLKYLDKWNKRRREIVSVYKSKLQNPNYKLILPKEAEYARHVYHLFVIRTRKRDLLRKYLEKKGIQTAIHFPSCVHLQTSFKYLDYKHGDFPESERASTEVLSLPMFPELTDNEIENVISAISKFNL